MATDFEEKTLDHFRKSGNLPPPPMHECTETCMTKNPFLTSR